MQNNIATIIINKTFIYCIYLLFTNKVNISSILKKQIILSNKIKLILLFFDAIIKKIYIILVIMNISL